MNKKILFTLLFCLLTSSCWGALATTTVWEVRKTGVATNGGGFDSALGGTDYSQQNAAQLTLTDCATTGAVATLTSVTGGFTDAMKGNIIYIASGTNFTTGYYEIVTYTNTNTVILDRVCATGAGINGNIKVGGAVDHPQRIAEKLIISDDYTDTLWIKKGVYTCLAGQTILSSDNGNIVNLIGYDTIRGDNPTIVTNMPIFDGEDAYYNGISWNYGAVMNCVVRNLTNYALRLTYGSIINCIAYDNDAAGASGIAVSEGAVINCIAFNNELGFNVSSATAINCIAYNNNYGFDSGGILVNCIAYNNNYGFNSDYGNIMNCIALNNTTYGFQEYSIISYFDYNCYYGNGTNLSGITAGAHDVNADPLFVNAAGNDFTLQSTSPLIGAGLSYIAGLTSNFYINIGVDQSDHTTGGGGSTVCYGESN